MMLSISTESNLEKDIPITWNWKNMDYNNDIGIDGELDLIINNQNILMVVEVKKDVKNHQLLTLIIHLKIMLKTFIPIYDALKHS